MASKNTVDITYQQWLASLKEKIRNSQLKAALKVNTEMLELYWEVVKELTEKQEESNWGDKIITQLAKDLSSEFPGVKGFSATNLKYIRKWFKFYTLIGQQPVDQLKITGGKLPKTKSQQAVDQIIQRPVGLFITLQYSMLLQAKKGWLDKNIENSYPFSVMKHIFA
jgi:hypothetical protein